MKKIIVLILVLLILGLFGCSQKTGQDLEVKDNTTVTQETDNSEINTTTISSDIESISKEIANIDTSDSGDAITPITDADITFD
ncbi:MAG: hypothetical protein ABIB43_00160 [archaeon]